MLRTLLLLLLVCGACRGTKSRAPAPPQDDKWAIPAALLEDDEDTPSIWQDFIDDVDGKFDASDFLDRDIGFLPIVVPITEPAIGFGLVGGLIFFHDKGEPKPGVPPTLTAVVGGATTNDTWLGGLIHQRTFKGGNIRSMAGAGYASVNLDFFGLGTGPGDDNSRDLNFEGAFAFAEVKHRIGRSDWFLGIDYMFTNIDTTLDLLPGTILPPFRFANTASGIGVLASYDTRKNHFTPYDGIDAVIAARFYNQALGSDNNFIKTKAHYRTWIPTSERITLAMRLDVDYATDDTPLYALPFVTLRGVPAFRYVGDFVVTAEVQPRFQITDRWGAVMFAGVGQAAGTLSDLSSENTVWSVGTGFRYMLARKRGIQAGIDVAYSDDEFAFYITVGTAWMR